ncbi:hypothetical protein GA0074696_3202 [Micromonospora purpureochromogenes]|uniref:Uncharacterized protein n=1 Tax=Micromonospora purpureochromogenes TaxID=47872 RepID=A0A1C4YB24_9ACTN|nr:hypothetical protein [Micromonospora purpureochromogenes]SCF17846.1 hypothetical protein GA0074696_3202 [Micromonospora purpureochromogenes]
MTDVLIAAALTLLGCAGLWKAWRFRHGRAPELGDSRFGYLMLPAGAAFLTAAVGLLAEAFVDTTSDPAAVLGVLTAILLITAMIFAVIKPGFLAPRPDGHPGSWPAADRTTPAAADPAPRLQDPIKSSELVPAWQNRVWYRAVTGAFITTMVISLGLSAFWFDDFDEGTDATDVRRMAVMFAVLLPLFWIVLARRRRRRAGRLHDDGTRRRG